MRIAREEIFGPVAGVIRVKDYDEAVAVANDTDFGLSAGICTASLKYARAFDEKVESLIVASHDGANRIQDPHWCKGGQS